MKILRFLPKKKWKDKMTIIQEDKNLTKLPLQELIRLLMTHEINMSNYQEVEEKKWHS